MSLKSILTSVNKSYSQPSSKQPEWESKGVGNDGQGKKTGRGNDARKGSGNKSKNRKITHKAYAKVEKCGFCGKDLSQQPSVKSANTRIIEDIPKIAIELDVTQVVQEKKYCPECQKVTTAKTDLALPKSDFGLNTTIATVYLWIASGLSFPRISSVLNTFFSQQISTSVLSQHVIRISKIMNDVYAEILENVRRSGILQADETGWRINGDNWWLWVFGTKDSAYYTIDKSRGKDVVRKTLGEIFDGVLVVDGWGAYLSLICEQQSCMAHLLRKIRKLHDAFPELRSVRAFYVKFRKILRDGEGLQKQKTHLEENVFNRRLQKLHNRLDELLKWKNPNNVLADAYAVLLSIYTTCKLREISFVDFMRASLKQHIKTGETMLIKEYVEIRENQIK